MSDRVYPGRYPVRSSGPSRSDEAEFAAIYVELRNAYLHTLEINRSLRTSLSRLSRDYHELSVKYRAICESHDILVDDQTSDL